MKNKLLFFYSRRLFWGIGLSYMFHLNGIAALISLLIGTLIGLFILNLIKVNDNISLFKKLASFVITVLCGIIIINFCHTLYLQNTPIILITFFSMICICFISKIKFTSFIRLSNILFYASIFLFLLKCFSLTPYVVESYFSPIAEFNVGKIFLGGCLFALTSVTPIIAFVKTKDNLIANYVLSTFTIFVMMFLIICVLGIKEAMLYRYPEYIILKRINMLNFISNVENIFSFAIFMDLTITSAAGLNNIKTDNKYINIGLSLSIIAVIVFFCQSNTNILFLYSSYPILITLLFFLALFPKKRQHNLIIQDYDNNG